MADDFDALLDEADTLLASNQAEPQPQQPQPQEQPQDDQNSSGASFFQGAANAAMGAYGAFRDTQRAIGVGAAKSVFETGDFITGEPTEAEKSNFRKSIEAEEKRLKEQSWVNSALIPISQFVTGLVGAGKLVKGAKMLGVGFRATKGGKAAEEITKAAAVGAIAFDPHDERLSNLIQEFPGLQNPITEYLAADPSDTAAEGRFKAVLESLGMDAVMLGSLKAGLSAYRAMRSGKAKSAAKALKEAEAIAAADPARGGKGVDPVSLKPVTETPLPKTIGEAFQPKEQPNITQVTSPSQGPESQGFAKRQPVKKPKPLPNEEENFQKITDHIINDAEALVAYGSRQNAVAAGYKFGGQPIPWQKLATGEITLDSMLDRLTDIHMKNLGRGAKTQDGLTIPDAQHDRFVNRRVQMWGEDPDQIRAILVSAGDNARRLAANMDAADALAIKMTDEAQQTWNKIRFGNLEEFGGDVGEAHRVFAQQAGLAMQLMTSSRQMLSGAARTLRRARGDIPRLSLEDIRKIKDLPPEALGKLFDQANGDMRALKEVLSRPSLLARLTDGASFLLVNNLLWGWSTHMVNIVTTGWEMVARPAQRALGATALKAMGQMPATEADAIRRSALSQYRFMAPLMTKADREYRFASSVLLDSARMAMRTFLQGESILAPYKVEFARRVAPSRAGGGLDFRPMHNLGDLGHNAKQATMLALGLPTRALGLVDEWTKQVNYRAMILADASLEAEKLGLSGQAYKDHLHKRLGEAFDEKGAAANAHALLESQKISFQQQLEPKGWGNSATLGYTTQNVVAAIPAMRLVLPFVRTPVNVLRRGVQYTPGLNMLQKEFNESIRGLRGEEAQAQAVGQMVMGSLISGAIAVMAANGMVTGSMPKNPTTRRQLLASGWKPNAITWERADGTKGYLQMSRFDPLGLPIGIVADLMDIMQHPDKYDLVVEELAPLLGMALAKQVQDRTYLRSLSGLIDAMEDPEASFGKWAGQMAGNMVPFSSALKNYAPDDSMAYIKEVRGIVDGVMATIPGLAENVPNRMDAWGDPITIRRAPWSTDTDHIVDQEMIRMATEFGEGPPNIPSARGRGGVDLRELTLEDGTNAYVRYQELAGHPPGRKSLKEAVASVIQRPQYQRAIDGSSGTTGTRQWMLSQVISQYREAAHAALMRDSAKYREAVFEAEKKARAAHATKTSPTADNVRAGQQADFMRQLGSQFGIDMDNLPQPPIPQQQ